MLASQYVFVPFENVKYEKNNFGNTGVNNLSRKFNIK